MSITLFSDTMTGTSTTVLGSSVRQALPTSASLGVSKVTVTIQNNDSVGSTVVDHASIGIQSSIQETIATPVELLFSGSSGFTLGPNSSITSDVTNLVVPAGVTAIVIFDFSNSAGTKIARDTPSTCTVYIQTATASYNQANPSGTWTPLTDFLLGVNNIAGSGAELFSAAPASYALTGSTTKLGVGFLASAASYAITGVATAMKRAMHLSLAAGSYVFTGKALVQATYLILGIGSYMMTGYALPQGVAAVIPKVRQALASLGLVRASPPKLSK